MATPNLAINLPWQSLAGQANALQGLGGDPRAAMAQLGQNYTNSYLGALNLNANLFGGIQTGYEALRSQLDKQYSDISGGYSKLYGDVLGKIAGTNQTNLQDINTQYAARQGEATQQMVNRGLGNSTVVQNMQRAIEMDRSRARTASENQFAQLQAQYMNNIGQSGLQAQQQGAQLSSQLGQNQLNWLNTIQAPYPQASMYQDLAKMYGAQLQGQQDRQAMQQLMPQGGGGTFSRGGVGGVVSGAGGNTLPWGPKMNYGTGLYGGSPSNSGYSTTDLFGGYGGGGGAWGQPNQQALAMAQAGGFQSGYTAPTMQQAGGYAGGYEYGQDYGGIDTGGLGGWGDSGYGGLPGGLDEYA